MEDENAVPSVEEFQIDDVHTINDVLIADTPTRPKEGERVHFCCSCG